MGTAGYRQIHMQMTEEFNTNISEYMVNKIKCNVLKLPFVRKKRKNRPLIVPEYSGINVYPNLPKAMVVTDINQMYSTDTSEYKIDKVKYHISQIIDVYSQEILACVISTNCNIDLMIDTMKRLISSGIKLDKVVLHSDRGAIYKSHKYKKMTEENSIIPSMSKPYCSTDNAWVECKHGQLKDFVRAAKPKNEIELQIAVKQFVQYNNNIKRLKKLNKKTPTEYRRSQEPLFN